MARGVSGGEGPEVAEDLGDGAHPQGATRGPEERPLAEILREHQRDEISEPEGGDGYRRLQRVPADETAAGAPHL